MKFAFIRTASGLGAGDETTQEMLTHYAVGEAVLMNFDVTTDPRGEGHLLVDHREAAAYASRIRDAMFALNDEAVYELHQELRETSDFYIAVASKLSAYQRRYLKDLVNERRAA